MFLLLVAGQVCADDFSPPERIDYWRSGYTELKASDDSRVDIARKIFKRLKFAAGVGEDENPQLYAVVEDPYNISLPIAIRDGWVIISKKVLDICLSDSNTGEDKLAFVLGHELAHLLYDSYMHIKLFNAIDKLRHEGRGKDLSIVKLNDLVSKPEHFAYREFEADERGIIIAAMAGFNTDSVIEQEQGQAKTSFFQEWQDAQGINRYLPSNISSTHPVIALREKKLLDQLRTVENRAQLFRLGMMYYSAGKFDLAARYFNEFLPYFQGREVYHNLAVSYHQLAIRSYLASSSSHVLNMKFNLVADPESRAISNSHRRGAETQQSYQALLKKAVKYYKKALQLDPDYQMLYPNLGAAHVLAGNNYDAIALLNSAADRWQKNSDILNVLGVAFYNIDKKNEALHYLKKAYQIDRNSAAVYNLGMMYYSMNQISLARDFWGEYLKTDSSSYWARNLRNKYQVLSPLTRPRGLPKLAFENVNGLQVRDFVQDIPKSWQLQRSYDLKEHRQKILRYANGIEAIVQGDAISMIKVHSDYPGKTHDGIAIGMPEKNILNRYGAPAMELTLNSGNYWVYPAKGLSFQLDNHKIVSWTVY